MWNLLFWVLVAVAILMSFLDVSKEDVQSVVRKEIQSMNNQTDKVTKNAVEINEKANKILDENEEYRLLVVDLREKLAEAHSKLTVCKETVQEDYTGTGY